MKGVLCIVVASLLFGIKPSGDKYVVLSGVAPICVVFYSQLILMVLAFLLTQVRRESLKVKWNDALYLMILGAVGMGVTSFLVNSATQHIPVGLAIILHFLYPTIVSVVMVLFFQQKFTIFKLIAIICSIGGMILITNMDGDGEISVIGILLALVSSLTYSFYMIANDKGKVNELSLLVKLVYSGLGSSLLFGLSSVFQGKVRLPGTVDAGIVLLTVCGFGNLGAFYFITAGIKQIGASTASFVNMLEPITSVIVSVIVYHDNLSAKIVAGMAMILSAALLVALDGYKRWPTQKLHNSYMQEREE